MGLSYHPLCGRLGVEESDESRRLTLEATVMRYGRLKYLMSYDNLLDSGKCVCCLPFYDIRSTVALLENLV